MSRVIRALLIYNSISKAAKSTKEDAEDAKKVESIKKMNLIKGSKVKTTPASKFLSHLSHALL